MISWLLQHKIFSHNHLVAVDLNTMRFFIAFGSFQTKPEVRYWDGQMIFFL